MNKHAEGILATPTSTAPLRPVLMATMFFAATVFGSAATANAEPNNGGEWDIEAYDKCMEQTIRSADACCISSGGWIAPDKPDGSPNCMAPPAAPAGSTLPGEQLNPNLPAPTRETLTPGPVPQPVQAAG